MRNSAMVLATAILSVSARLLPTPHPHNRFVRTRTHRRAAVDAVLSSDQPANLASGSLTAEAGCSLFYVAGQGDDCEAAIATIAGLTETILVNANPSIDCSVALTAGVGYCVSGPSSELQFGSVDLTRGCRKFHRVTAGETCAVIAAANGLTTDVFIAQNPGVSVDCSTMWTDKLVCVDSTGEVGSYDDVSANFGSVAGSVTGAAEVAAPVIVFVTSSIEAASVTAPIITASASASASASGSLSLNSTVRVSASGTSSASNSSSATASNASDSRSASLSASSGSASGRSSGSVSSTSASSSSKSAKPTPNKVAIAAARVKAIADAREARKAAVARQAAAEAKAKAEKEAAEAKAKAEKEAAEAKAAAARNVAEEKVAAARKAAKAKAAAARRKAQATAHAQAQAAAKTRVAAAKAKVKVKVDVATQDSSSSSASSGGKSASDGQVTFYEQGSQALACYQTSACSPSDDAMSLAIPGALWDGGNHCGKTVKISGVSFMVCDLCPSQYCDSNHFDLTRAGARRIMGSNYVEIGLMKNLDYELSF